MIVDDIEPPKPTPIFNGTLTSTNGFGNSSLAALMHSNIQSSSSAGPSSLFLGTPLSTMIMSSSNNQQQSSGSSSSSAGGGTGAGGCNGRLQPRQRRKVPEGELCAVCSDRATGYHYGVASCNGCKTFLEELYLSIQWKL
ncbi:Nuclear receptor domain-containing protein [Meloidogyne graminicola]|uniref:Nuclear receptor domain-containing protein n=1 Tax=Meloidogyne graminicola TaxID=189291 RepID=A0A8S9ZII9_9BILA|nr:Nuclear receptor domain-containing protein [Meloidogyne graminicola]